MGNQSCVPKFALQKVKVLKVLTDILFLWLSMPLLWLIYKTVRWLTGIRWSISWAVVGLLLLVRVGWVGWSILARV